MGGDWVDVHPVLEEPRYFDVEKLHEDWMEEQWQEYILQKEENCAIDSTGEPAAAPAGEPARASVGSDPASAGKGQVLPKGNDQVSAGKGQGSKGGNASKGKGSKGSAALRRGKSTHELDPAQDVPTNKKAKVAGSESFPELMKDATRLKTQYHSVTSSARSLIDIIEAAPHEDASPSKSDKPDAGKSDATSAVHAWSWANTPLHVGVLRAVLAELTGSLNDFACRALINDLAKMKKETGTETMILELRNFKKLRKPIETVAFEHQKLLDQFDIMQRKPVSPSKLRKGVSKRNLATE